MEVFFLPHLILFSPWLILAVIMSGLGMKNKKEQQPDAFTGAIPASERLPNSNLKVKVVRAEDEARLKQVAEQLLEKISQMDGGKNVEITLAGKKLTPKK